MQGDAHTDALGHADAEEINMHDLAGARIVLYAAHQHCLRACIRHAQRDNAAHSPRAAHAIEVYLIDLYRLWLLVVSSDIAGNQSFFT